MTQKSSMAPKLSAQDKAARTTEAAETIMGEERKASDAKVARLRALRLAQEPQAAAAPARAATPAAPKRARAATIRKLALQPDAQGARRKKS